MAFVTVLHYVVFSLSAFVRDFFIKKRTESVAAYTAVEGVADLIDTVCPRLGCGCKAGHVAFRFGAKGKGCGTGFFIYQSPFEHHIVGQ